MAYNTIRLKNYLNVFVEHKAAAEIYPGMLLLLGSTADTVKAHDDDNPSNCLPMFALEDELQGKGIDDPYAAADKVNCWIPSRGDEVYAILADGQHVEVGGFLASAGNGTLKAYSAGACVGIALEHMDLSGSSVDETSSTPLGFNKRIKVRIL